MQVSPMKAGLIAMPIILIAGFLYVIFSGFGSASQGALSEYAVGEMRAFRVIDAPPPPPAAVFLDANGGEVRMSDYEGRIVLLNLWATWCAPCVEEMPALDRLEGELGGDDFAVVTVSLDRSIDQARGFFERTSLQHLPLLHDASFSSPDAVGAIGLPVSVLYDRRGNEIGRLMAPAEWDSEDAMDLIRAAIRDY